MQNAKSLRNRDLLCSPFNGDSNIGDDLWFLVVAQLQVFVLELLVLFCDLKDYNLVFSIQKVYSTPDGANISLNSTPVLISVAKQRVVLLPHSTNLFISHRNRLSGFEYMWCSISFTVLNVERPVCVCVWWWLGEGSAVVGFWVWFVVTVSVAHMC